MASSAHSAFDDGEAVELAYLQDELLGPDKVDVALLLPDVDHGNGVTDAAELAAFGTVVVCTELKSPRKIVTLQKRLDFMVLDVEIWYSEIQDFRYQI